MRNANLRRAMLALLLPLGLTLNATAGPHSGDYRLPFGAFSLDELLRIIQIYNLGGYACTGEGEDGFTPGGLPCTSDYHDGDYSPPDGQFSLGEVLRIIQFYNANRYGTDCNPNSEDGFQPLGDSLEDCPTEGEEEGEVQTEGEGVADGEGNSEGLNEGDGEELEGETEGTFEGTVEGVSEGNPEGVQEGAFEGTLEGEGALEGTEEGLAEGEGQSEGEGAEEGTREGSPEGSSEGQFEGSAEGAVEGTVEGTFEGTVEGASEGEGAFEGEGSIEGSTEGDVGQEGEGALEGEGSSEGEGALDGEGGVEGEGASEGEGALEGEGAIDGEGGLEPEAGPFAIGSINRTFIDPSRSNRSIPTTIYYPAMAAGSNQPIAGNEANRFPVVVFGHGFVIGISFYNYIWNGLVPDGYIVVMCDTETSLSPNHGNFGRDLAFLVDQLQAEGTNPQSIFHERVALRSAVSGHSMGGGATMLSVQHSPNISAIVPIAAADTNPSAIAAAPGITIPAMIIDGSKDCVAPPASNTVPMYDGLASDCRYYASIVDGSHCQFAVDSTICNLGQIICPGQTYVAAQSQRATTVGLMKAWLDVVLKQDTPESTFDFLLSTESTAGRITFEDDCE